MPEPPACLPPDPAPHGPTRFAVPSGAVDSHAHVIGLPPAYPFAAGRSYTPPEASPSAYLHMLNATGMTYGVLVQVSVHGTDNHLLLETLRAHPARLRGVAVIPPDISDAELARLKDAGITGLRLNVLYGGGGVGLDDMERFGALCRDWGWHLQVLLDVARALPDLAPRLARLPIPIVVDHMGHFPASLGAGVPGFHALLGLVRDGAWVKLSGACRLADAPWAETVPLARALLAAAPDRCVWGSDWPHVAHFGPMMNVGDLLDLLADWAPDEAERHRVLIENPHRLYGFRLAPQGATAPGSCPRSPVPGSSP